MSTTSTAPQEPSIEYESEFDPYVLSPSEIEAPPRTFRTALRQVGPGLILAGAIVGTGELIATTNLGARVGFMLLWLVIFSCFIKVFVQVELGRHAISSGEPTLTTFSRLPGPGLVFVWWFVIMTLFTQFQLGAMVGGVGHALHSAIPWLGIAVYPDRPEMPFAILVAVGATALLLKGSYSTVEKGTMLMVVGFTLMTVLCVALLPFIGHPIQWGEVGRGLEFWNPPPFEVREMVLGAAIAMFGITGVGASELVAYPYWCIEKGYARRAGPRPADDGEQSREPLAEVLEVQFAVKPNDSEAWAHRAKGWMRVMRLDAWVSMAIYTVATLAFFFLGAAVLYGRGDGLGADVKSMTDALASMYAPVMGAPAARWFIVIGVVAVLFSTLFASTAANARAFTDALHVSRMIRIPNHTARRWWVNLFCCFPLIDLVLFGLLGNPVEMVIIGGFAQALTLPMIAGAAIYLRYKRTDQRLRPGKAWDVFLWISMLAFCVTAVIGLKNVKDQVEKRWNLPAAVVEQVK